MQVHRIVQKDNSTVAWYSCSTGGDRVSGDNTSWEGNDITVDVVEVPVDTSGAKVDDGSDGTVVHETSGGGSGSLDDPKPPKVNAKTTPTTPQKVRDLGKCLLRSFKAYAKNAYADVPFSFDDKEPPDGATNCTFFLQDYITKALGKKLTADTEFKLRNRGYSEFGTLSEVVQQGHPSIQGPRRALVEAGVADPVDDIRQAIAGDLVQMWSIRGDGSVSGGHQAVVESVTLVASDNGHSAYYVKLFGAHPEQTPGGTIGSFFMDDGPILRTKAGTVKFFVARIKPEKAVKCP